MPGSAKATPMEAATRTSLPSIAVRLGEGQPQPVGDLVDAGARGRRWSRVPSPTISAANSSPPRRAAVSPGADRVLEPAGGLDEQFVAGLVADACR